MKSLVEEKHMKIEKHFPGLTCFLDGVRMVPIESIPGVMDTGWMPSTRATRNSRVTEESTDVDVLAKHLKKVLQFVSLSVFYYLSFYKRYLNNLVFFHL